MEVLRGNRSGQHSIRINDQWRICFRWDSGNAFEVEITDYHEPSTLMTREQKAILAATPGRLLKEEFLDAHHLSQIELSRRTGIPRSTINEIIKGKRAITAEVAFTLGTFFGMDPQFWINLQSRYDLRVVQFGQAAAILARVQPLTPA